MKDNQDIGGKGKQILETKKSFKGKELEENDQMIEKEGDGKGKEDIKSENSQDEQNLKLKDLPWHVSFLK